MLTLGPPAPAGVKKPPNPITLTPAALQHLQKLRQESGGEGLLLRMGVKSGGCSGMSCEPRGVQLGGGLCCLMAWLDAG